MTDEESRRRFLALVGSAAATAVAGCGGDAGSTTRTATDAPETTASTTTTDGTTASPAGTTDGTPTAAPSLTGVAFEPRPVRQFRPATLVATVENAGDRPFEGSLDVSVDGDWRTGGAVSVPAGGTADATAELELGAVGSHEVTVRVGATGGPADAVTESVEVARYPASFVGRDGTDFVVDGDRFRYAGANNNHLPVRQWGERYVDRLLDYVAGHGLSVVRTWGFPPAWTDDEVHLGPGEFRDDWFAHFDYVVAAAKRRGIRLVLPLINNWYGTDHAPSPAAYADWSDTAGTKNDFFADEQANEYYRNYVEHFLTRKNPLTGLEYREDPTILMWEVGNQMEYHGERRGESLADWYDAAARHIKSIDDDHLVGTGMAGATGDVYESWNVRNSYVATHRSDAIDACCFHTYPVKRWQGETTVREQSAFAEFVRSHVREAHDRVGKPVYFGEFGAIVDPEDGLTVEQRDEFFRTGTQVAREEGLDGIQFWYPELATVNGRPRDHGDNPLGIFPGDESTWAVIESYAETLG